MPETARTVLISGFFKKPGMYLYSDSVDHYSIFARYFRQGIVQSERCLYVYSHTKLRSSVNSFIEDGRLQNFELQGDGASFLPVWFEECCTAAEKDASVKGIRFVLDFSRIVDPDVFSSLRSVLKKYSSILPFSGIIAFDIDTIPDTVIEDFAVDFPQVMVATGGELMVSFSDDVCPVGNLEMVNRDVVESVVKKMLEPIILASLVRPVSGYDILQEIYGRFHVRIPMARVYSYLYKLEEGGYLEVKNEGRSKIYVLTKQGKSFIEQRVREIHVVMRNIAGES